MLAPDEETKQAVANMPENVAWQRLLEQQKVHDRKKK
jgi:hypothetical protein